MANPIRDWFESLPWRRARPQRVDNASILSATAAGNTRIDLHTSAQPTSQPQVSGVPVTDVEFGVSGTAVYGGYIQGEDYNKDLDDFTKAVRIYDKMRKGDAQINAMLSVLKLPLRGATWMCVPPEDGDLVDQQIADFCNACLFEDDAMDFSWDYTLRHILLQLDHGFSVFEVVWTVDESGCYRVKRLAPRLPRTIKKWHVDRSGRLLSVEQYAPVPQSRSTDVTSRVRSRAIQPATAVPTTAYDTTVRYEWLSIPADYLAVFTLNREGDNYEGVSVLRTVYRNWFYKDQAYNLEGVRLDRFGVGIPVAKLTEEHTLNQDDLTNLMDVLKRVRANERSFLIAPPGVSYELLPSHAGATAGSGASQWIDHHDQQIARNVLAGFLTMGQDQHGTLGFGSRLTDMFVSSLNGVAAGIASDLKQHVIKKLCDLNFDMTQRKYPRVTCRDLEQVDMSHLVEALAVLAGTYITPDDDTEKMLRKVLQIPPLAAENTRKAQAEAQTGTMAAAGGSGGPMPNQGMPMDPAGPAGPPTPQNVVQNPTMASAIEQLGKADRLQLLQMIRSLRDNDEGRR